MNCDKCGQPHPGCAGHPSNGELRPCAKPPMKGTTVCRNHGGKTPNAQRGAAQRQARDKAAKAMATLGEPITIDPVHALTNLIHWSAGHVEWYRQQIQNHLPEGLVWGETEIRDSDLQGLTRTQRSSISLWLQLYNEERDRLTTISSKAIHAGLAEREVKLAEQQGALLAEVVRRILADLELTPEQSAKAADLVPRHLRSVA